MLAVAVVASTPTSAVATTSAAPTPGRRSRVSGRSSSSPGASSAPGAANSARARSSRCRACASIHAPDSAYIGIHEATNHTDTVDRVWRGVVTRDGWKYVCLEGQPWLLFNHNDDPYELANHAHNSRYAAERRRLQARLEQWIRETEDNYALPQVG